jgi:hypothetical protein
MSHLHPRQTAGNVLATLVLTNASACRVWQRPRESDSVLAKGGAHRKLTAIDGIDRVASKKAFYDPSHSMGDQPFPSRIRAFSIME